MPRIPENFLNCSIYIYQSRIDALDGCQLGGSGFLVGVMFQTPPPRYHVYAVTNKHVVQKGGRFIRLNRKDGGTEIIETEPTDWIQHPDGDDLVVAPVIFKAAEIKCFFIDSSRFLQQRYERSALPGDDVFMIGRFLTHDGKQRNTPTVRFGNIAMTPLEKIHNAEFGIDQESFLIECRSMSGYSGSPVFIYTESAPSESHLTRFSGGAGPLRLSIPFLLGVDWCHLTSREIVREREDGNPVEQGWYVKSSTGMAGVIPAWRLADILKLEELDMRRRKCEEANRREVNRSDIVLDSTTPESFSKRFWK